jgi:hypothetical protein
MSKEKTQQGQDLALLEAFAHDMIGIHPTDMSAAQWGIKGDIVRSWKVWGDMVLDLLAASSRVSTKQGADDLLLRLVDLAKKTDPQGLSLESLLTVNEKPLE